jgi:hypothetical protein
MKTIKKMYQIKKLMDEVESEVRETAKSIEDIDTPLYRMLTEDCADIFKHMSKNLHSSSSGYPIDSWEKQLNYAHKITIIS